jgi:hypothetical protein
LSDFHDNVAIIQDMDDERHVLLRPIEKIPRNDFFEIIQNTMDQVKDCVLWEVDLEEYVATRVENVVD